MKYRDEKYVEHLEEENKELRRKLDNTTEGVQGRALRRALRGEVVGSSSAVGQEELYRRARTEVAAEAGAGYGRVSLEALYLLPAEFTNVYQRLFLRALKESPGRSGEPNPTDRRPARLVRKEEGQVLDRDPDRGGGRARSGGRRHRDHWIVKDELAFRLKERVDRELKALAEEVLESLSKPRAAEVGSRSVQCQECQRFLKSNWRHCPHCGERKEEDRSPGR